MSSSLSSRLLILAESAVEHNQEPRRKRRCRDGTEDPQSDDLELDLTVGQILLIQMHIPLQLPNAITSLFLTTEIEGHKLKHSKG